MTNTSRSTNTATPTSTPTHNPESRVRPVGSGGADGATSRSFDACEPELFGARDSLLMGMTNLFGRERPPIDQTNPLAEIVGPGRGEGPEHARKCPGHTRNLTPTTADRWHPRPPDHRAPTRFVGTKWTHLFAAAGTFSADFSASSGQFWPGAVSADGNARLRVRVARGDDELDLAHCVGSEHHPDALFKEMEKHRLRSRRRRARP